MNILELFQILDWYGGSYPSVDFEDLLIVLLLYALPIILIVTTIIIISKIRNNNKLNDQVNQINEAIHINEENNIDNEHN